MDLHSFEDTIAAISTPPGQSGIGIVRLSGPEAVAIADELFSPAARGRTVASLGSFTNAYGRIVDGGEVVDEVILTVMRAPRTYTTQDVVEINCHGGMIPLRKALELVLHRGARLADPGEFTKRAFVFGRIDLAQAESVLDVINARSDEAHRAAVSQLEGRFSRLVNELRETALDILTRLEAAIDFGDEGLQLPTAPEVGRRCGELAARIEAMLAGARAGRALREGLRTAIVGRPNVGKSSLMNALLGHERVIVTPVPGTTRDVVEDSITIGGVPVILADTAGLRTTNDEIEAAGVLRSSAAMAQADLVLVVLDGSVPLTEDDDSLLAAAPMGRTVLVLNKSDLPAIVEASELQHLGARATVSLSARTEAGLEALREAVTQTVWGGEISVSPEALVTNVRHSSALREAQTALRRAQSAAEAGHSEEYLASDVREALDALGLIVGATLREDVINRIFETFCIGK